MLEGLMKYEKLCNDAKDCQETEIEEMRKALSNKIPNLNHSEKNRGHI